eukprot:RCo009455
MGVSYGSPCLCVSYYPGSRDPGAEAYDPRGIESMFGAVSSYFSSFFLRRFCTKSNAWMGLLTLGFDVRLDGDATLTTQSSLLSSLCRFFCGPKRGALCLAVHSTPGVFLTLL